MIELLLRDGEKQTHQAMGMQYMAQRSESVCFPVSKLSSNPGAFAEPNGGAVDFQPIELKVIENT
jgi:hypothetical protein